ncbi:SCO7613 C-terminal domain-containing membrane protein [Homoserinibacter sp. YIM 151385]|uniref:SCO7613 C-terminal domain-containing membrane protein n=1 Tax=Homoserinibacter sp. YIM 151385 TaxID=2985506 RepID=UPI0022F0664F|nr:hypothetical protein [Homoserinibacter sp. YIM 151385]WBU38449.1 hypothetical protein OF852_02365 [Homoserinibacter sp. YIM 151385]
MTRAPRDWSEGVADALLATATCPRCAAMLVTTGPCGRCGAVLGGPEGVAVWEASQRAAAAVLERRRLIGELPTAPLAPPTTVPRAPAAASAAPAPGAGIPAAVPAPNALPQRESQISVQSVLAVAGAGLFAVAAFVFTFLNPDLTDIAVRTTIIGAISVLFLLGAWQLHRRGLTFSAEAIGALGLVFVALDIRAFADLGSTAELGCLYAAIGTAFAGTAMLAITWLVRLRTWLWLSLLGLASVPAMLGYASGETFGAVVGHLGAIAAALAAQRALPVLEARFERSLRADTVTLTVVHAVLVVVVVIQLVALDTTPAWVRVLGAAAVLTALAASAVLATAHRIPAVWSAAAGVLATAALAILPVSLPDPRPELLALLMPCAAALAVLLLGLAPRAMRVRAAALDGGALAVAGLVAIPSATIALGCLLLPLGDLLSAGSGHDPLLDPAWVPRDDVLLPLLGALGAIAALAGSSWAAWRRERRDPSLRIGAAIVLAVVLLHALLAWLPLPRIVVIPLVLLLAAGSAATAIRLTTNGRPLRIRVALATTAQTLLVLAAIQSWIDRWLGVATAAGILLVLVLATRALPRVMRPTWLALGYAYGLAALGVALDLLGLDPEVVLALVTAAGAVVALVATAIPAVRARSWWAILLVTGIPFLLGIVSVLIERSGWTALSTGLVFLLALTLLLTRRSGLTVVVRALAASILVPSLAVVVISLGAQLLATSASPVTLPVIGVLVAAALPSTRALGALLARRGHGSRSSRAAALAVELSTLLTAGLALVLALAREAAGLTTACIVLILIGIGAAAARLSAGRRYGWWLATAAWTGALWCVWALAGVDILEPYILPPALAAATIGAIAVARRGVGVALATSGLASAILPSLVVHAVVGSGTGSVLPWRAIGLGAAAVLLLAAALAIRGEGAGRRLVAMRVPLLAFAGLTAGSAPLLGIRWGLGLDTIAGVAPALVILPVLGTSLAAALLGLVVAHHLVRSVRRHEPGAARLRPVLEARLLWLPVALYAVVAPWTAIRRDWTPIWLTWALMVMLLVGMVAIAIRDRRSPTSLPAAAWIYPLAWITGVVGWSQRDLRVEWFSLPLGLAVLALGIVALTRRDRIREVARPRLLDWPFGYRGSWRVLGPGIVLTMLPSVLATGTDPQTWRAVLVIALALLAILVGSSRRLAAPFVLGLVVLPIENVIVFAVQIGRSIGALPWWITLATAGAVLLAIAVGSERRTASGTGVAARLRELE